jgi:hypothetical protein
MDSCYTEAIILSQQQGEICTDPNAPYIPGARLYLAHHKMIDDGIVTRDGLHAGKVKGSIDLNKYLLGVISAGDIVGNEDSWMPRKFSEMANEAFKKGK